MKYPKNEFKGILYEDPANNYIITKKNVYDILYKQSSGGILVGLYQFYCYTAKWQKTNSVKATNPYCIKGTGYGETIFLQAKKKLIELGLIEKQKKGNFGGWYIKVNYYISQEPGNQGSFKNPENQVLGSRGSNALYINNINALNKNNINLHSRAKMLEGDFIRTKPAKPKKQKPAKKYLEFIPMSKQLASIVQDKKQINITSQKISSWANSIRLLNTTDKIPIDRIQKVLDWYEKNYDTDYCPVAECGKTFRDKFIRIEDAIKRQKNPYKPKQPNSFGSHRSGTKLDYSHIKVNQYERN